MSKNRIALICLIALIAFFSFGCSNKEEAEKELSKREIVMAYNQLNSAYVELLDYYDALQNKKITKFNWRIIAESSRAQCNRVLEAVKSSENPVAKKLPPIAKDILSFTEELEGEVDHGTKADMSYKETIASKLEEIRPEIEQMKKEVLEESK